MEAIKFDQLKMICNPENSTGYQQRAWKEALKNENLSNLTITSYDRVVRTFFEEYKKLDKNKLLKWRSDLIDKRSPASVNQSVQAMNKYLVFIKKDKLRLKNVKRQRVTFVEDVISEPDYEFVKAELRKRGNMKCYWIVRFLGATGARVSEMVKLKIEHVKTGYYDIYTKGGKIRRIYIPKALQAEALEYFQSIGRENGYVFINKYGGMITTRGFGAYLRENLLKLGIDERVAHPHSFRHRFAKNFLAKYKDIALLADLMGHDSIETTSIYLRMSSSEQREIVDEIVTW